MAGELAVAPGEYPELADWKAHLNTLMPEVRLKQVLELRGADTGSVEHGAALAAVWTGLLYDPLTLSKTARLVQDWSLTQ